MITTQFFMVLAIVLAFVLVGLLIWMRHDKALSVRKREIQRNAADEHMQIMNDFVVAASAVLEQAAVNNPGAAENSGKRTYTVTWY